MVSEGRYVVRARKEGFFWKVSNNVSVHLLANLV